MQRDRQVNIRLSEDELEQLRRLAQAQDRSINSYLRSLIRQAVNKSTIDLPQHKKAKQELIEYAQ